MIWLCSSSTTRNDFGSISVQHFFDRPFLIIDDVDLSSYAYDNTPYVTADNVDEVIDSLGQAANALFNGFKDNIFQENYDKYHLPVSSSNFITMKIRGSEIKNSYYEKLLEVKLNHKLLDLCKKATCKIMHFHM